MKTGSRLDSFTVFGSLTAAAAVLTAPTVAAQQTPLDEIIVTSSIVTQPRRQLGTAVSVIESAEMELRGYDGLADILRTQTGIGVGNSGGAGKSTAVSIRGEDSFRTLLMIDGVKALDPSGPQVAPHFDSLVTTGDLQRVEVLRGPQGFIYGADAGGVVNVITQRGADDFGGRVGVEIGDYSMRKAEAALSGGGDRGDYFVSVVDLTTDGFNARTDDTVLQDDDGAENTTLHTKLGWNLTDAVRLQLVARDIDAEAQYDACGFFSPQHDCVTATAQMTYKVSADVAGDLFSHSFGYSNADIERDNFAGGVSTFSTHGGLARLEYTGSYKPSNLLTLVYGVDLQDEELTASDAFRSRKQDGYYFEYQGAFGNAFFASLGARYDDNETFGSHTSSRLSVAYVQDLRSDRSLKYRASVGNGYRAPSLYESAYNFGQFASPPAAGVLLTEETSAGYDIGIEYVAGDFRFEATYFDQQIEDAIEFDLAAFSGYLQTQGVSTSKGLEIAADVSLGERWQLLANWTYNDAKDAAGQQRLRRPKNLSNVGVQYRAVNERLRFLANYRLSSDAVDTSFFNTVALPDYEVLDLSVTFDASDVLQAYGRVQNAADETYTEVLGYNTAGRSIYGGVRLRF